MKQNPPWLLDDVVKCPSCTDECLPPLSALIVLCAEKRMQLPQEAKRIKRCRLFVFAESPMRSTADAAAVDTAGFPVKVKIDDAAAQSHSAMRLTFCLMPVLNTASKPSTISGICRRRRTRQSAFPAFVAFQKFILLLYCACDGARLLFLRPHQHSSSSAVSV